MKALLPGIKWDGFSKSARWLTGRTDDRDNKESRWGKALERPPNEGEKEDPGSVLRNFINIHHKGRRTTVLTEIGA